MTSQLQWPTTGSKPSQLSRNETGTSEAAWMPTLFQALPEHAALSTVIWAQFPLGLSLRFHEQLYTVITVPWSSEISPREEWPFFFWVRCSYLTPASAFFSQQPTDQVQWIWLKRSAKDSKKKKQAAHQEAWMPTKKILSPLEHFQSLQTATGWKSMNFNLKSRAAHCL